MKRRLIVRGRVQGVGYRWHCKEQADRLGVDGWVRNRADGAVEVVMDGPDGAVEALVDWCRVGPRHALVSEVELADPQPFAGPGFVVAP